MNDKIAPGLKAETETIVCQHNVASHVSKFSTPAMIQLMEQASALAVSPLLEPGQVSVGFEVSIRHMAPSSIGARVVARAELTDVSRNRLTFTVEAYDGDTKIGEGTHRRAVITPSAEE